MALLTLRQIKGFPITDNEMDANFTNLNRDSFLSVRNSTSWVANTTYSVGEFLNVGDRFYYVQNTGTTGSVAPTHTSGSAVNGTITLVASASSPYYSAKDVLDKIKLLDGINSGLDADILQGLTPFSLLPITPDKSSIVSRDSVGNSAFNNITVASINGISITNFIVNGSNVTLGNLSTTGNTTLGDTGTDTLTINSQLSANGSVGTNGQVLTSRGANNSPQWTTITQGDMFRADNLAGLTNISLARTNIGAASLGANTFTGQQTVPDDAYDATTWNGNNTVPTKNAVRDKIESMPVPPTVLNATNDPTFSSTSSTQPTSAEWVVGEINQLALGVNQTWQNVTASRSIATTYTNTTGKPITVNIILTTTGTNQLSFTFNINGNVVWRESISFAGAGQFTTLSSIIPNQNTYSIAVGTGNAISSWSEMR